MSESNPVNNQERCYQRAANVSEIAPGTGKTVEVNEQDIALFNYQGEFYAISDLCPHRGAPLAEGFLEDGKVFCPWHCFDFNLQTGECTIVPSLRVQAYEVKVEGDEVFVRC
jgi:NAD(P)H-dependent nitrite reductase small subunit